MSEDQAVTNPAKPAPASGAAGCLVIIVLVVVVYVGFRLLTSGTSPLGLSPSELMKIRGIDGDLLQFDEEDGEFFTDYLDRFSVEIKAESLHTNADYIEIELPHMPEAAPIGAEFVRSVVNRVPYHKHVGQEAGEWLTEKWGSTIRTKRFGKVCVRIETYKGRAVLIRITGD